MRGAEWFDQTIMSGVNGFKLNDFTHIVGFPLRRWYAADWFQPVLRIGAEGDVELALEGIDVMPGDELPRPLNPTDLKDKGAQASPFASRTSMRRAPVWCGCPNLKCDEPIPNALLPAAREIWRKQGLADQMVAEFVAAESGEVFLYVNDAVRFCRSLARLGQFYKNNSGTAQVTLQRMPLPPSVTRSQSNEPGAAAARPTRLPRFADPG